MVKKPPLPIVSSDEDDPQPQTPFTPPETPLPGRSTRIRKLTARAAAANNDDLPSTPKKRTRTTSNPKPPPAPKKQKISKKSQRTMSPYDLLPQFPQLCRSLLPILMILSSESPQKESAFNFSDLDDPFSYTLQYPEPPPSQPMNTGEYIMNEDFASSVNLVSFEREQYGLRCSVRFDETHYDQKFSHFGRDAILLVGRMFGGPGDALRDVKRPKAARKNKSTCYLRVGVSHEFPTSVLVGTRKYLQLVSHSDVRNQNPDDPDKVIAAIQTTYVRELFRSDHVPDDIWETGGANLFFTQDRRLNLNPLLQAHTRTQT
ncbi:hypothetical protein K435DRAFT_807023 [Dendrothele bispora CBS 962.96]|uniref:Uncharacterized protein n=1 Tax=Dendrothele bispora (strain CBS 962.96) TaxID=1314807 RepID=A0A4S8L606_DENBC|nr:hypothetical protein K435DRAFT_807023 [Dendrothele bispora CBS 962.96]